ncbi:MAG: hypothetical protein R3E68_11660, partial [Burkholderiaceae bacterium]
MSALLARARIAVGTGLRVACLAALLSLSPPAYAADDKPIPMPIGASFAPDSPVLGAAQKRLVNLINTLSNGSINARLLEAGDPVPPRQFLEAVGNGSLDAAFTSSQQWFARDPAFSLFAAVPFGPAANEYLAWMNFGGGERLFKELYARYNIEAFVCGMTAPMAGAWFVTPVPDLASLKGKRVRSSGLGAMVLKRVGVATRSVDVTDLVQALRLNTLDGTEASWPAFDEPLEIDSVARHYYFPGWQQQSALNHLLVSKARWESLNKNQRAIVQAACQTQLLQENAESEAVQAAAMARLASRKIDIQEWPPEVMAALDKAWQEIAGELAAASPEFKKIWSSQQAFRVLQRHWRENA